MSLAELLELPEIVEIRDNKEFDYSRDFNLESFEISRREIVNSTLNAMADYLDLPYIIDSFSSHDKRRVFRDGLSLQRLEVYSNNALRAGRANAVCISAHILSRCYLGNENNELQDILREVKEIGVLFSPQVYDTLDSARKLTLAYSFKKRVFEVLKYFEKSN